MKRTKSILAVVLTLAMLFSLAGCGTAQESSSAAEAPAASSEEAAPASEAAEPASEAAPVVTPQAEVPAEPAEEPKVEEAAKAAVESMNVKVSEGNMKTGTLALLNLDEAGRTQIAQLRQLVDWELVRQGYSKGGFQNINTGEVIYYDTLNTMLMALNAGQVDSVDLYSSVAAYLCKENKDLVSGEYTWDEEQSAFVRSLLKGVLTDDFSFLMMEEKGALRNEFDSVLGSMKLDGTLDKLAEEYIKKADTTKKAELPKIDGAETIRVGVTGDLPPIDFVAADGTPQGYNVAVLAEISSRLKKNIELVLIDSGARATALASGNVDVVFWALTSEYVKNLSGHTDALDIYMSAYTEEEKAVTAKIKEILTADKANMDIPSGTIATVSYFSDFAVPVVTRAKANELGVAIPAEQVDPAQPTPTPTPIPQNSAPVVTKSPSSETVEEGDSCYFVAKADNSIWSIWHFVSPDGLKDVKYADINDVFGSLKVIDGNAPTMQLKNIPKEMNGWRVYCLFTNETDSVASGSASLSVTAANNRIEDSEIYVYPQSGKARIIYQTEKKDWFDYDGVYYANLGDGLFKNSVTGVVYADTEKYWYSGAYYKSKAIDARDVVNEEGRWLTLYYNNEDGWYDGWGDSYTDLGSGTYLNENTNVVYASSDSYWESSDYYYNYDGEELGVVNENGTWVSIFKTAKGWFDHNGNSYWTSGDGLYRNTYTGVLYSEDESYWDAPAGEGNGSFKVYTEDGQVIYIWHDSATGDYTDEDGAIYYDNGDQSYTSAGSGRIVAEYKEYFKEHPNAGGETNEDETGTAEDEKYTVYDDGGDTRTIVAGGGGYYTPDGVEFRKTEEKGVFKCVDDGTLWSTDPDYWED